MSRKVLPTKDPKHTLVVGLDHAVGYFIQVFGPGEDEILLDEDQGPFTFPKLDRQKMVKLIQAYGDGGPACERSMDLIWMDLDPAM